MPADYLLEIDGIKGESKDSKHPDTIEIESVSWGASNAGTMAFGSGGGAGKVHFEDIHFTASVNRASPSLILACATGTHIKKAQLFVRKQGGQQQDYLVIVLEDLLVSAYQSSDNGPGTVPMDQFSLNFATVEFKYRMQKDDGSLEPPITAGWNLKQNKKK